MLAGYAETDVTPPPGEEMTGYGYFLNRRARGTLDPLRARALALSDGRARAVIIQLDLLGLSRAQVDAIRVQAQQRFGLPGAALMLHCTHTHTGPATAPLEGCGSPSGYYPHALTKHLLDVIDQALDDLREVSATRRFDTDFADGFAWNRVGSDEVDTRVRGVEFRCPGAAPILVVSYACHPVTLGRLDQYSADYPGYLLAELNAYGARTVYLNGCCGDIDPVSNTVHWGGGTQDTLRIYGRDLAAAVHRGVQDAGTWEIGPLRMRSTRVPVPFEPLHARLLREELATVEKHLHEHPEDGPARVKATWCRRMLEATAAGRLEDIMTAEVQAIACGEVVFAALASEAFTRLGRIIRDAVPERHLLIAGTSNGVLGYLGTPEDARRSGYASGAAARIYGMAPPIPEGGVQWARRGAQVVRQAAELGPGT